MENYRCEKCGGLFSKTAKYFNPRLHGSSGRMYFKDTCPFCLSEDITARVMSCSFCGDEIYEGYDYYIRCDGEVYCTSCISHGIAGLSDGYYTKKG